MDLRLTVLLVSIFVFISSTEAGTPPECNTEADGDRPSYCDSSVESKGFLYTLLERLFEKELVAEVAEERHVDLLEELQAWETRQENECNTDEDCIAQGKTDTCCIKRGDGTNNRYCAEFGLIGETCTSHPIGQIALYPWPDTRASTICPCNRVLFCDWETGNYLGTCEL